MLKFDIFAICIIIENMKEKRFYFNGNLNENSKVILEGDEFHHLANVMRSRVGEKVCLFNGNGTFYFGEITQINKKNAEISITRTEVSENEPTVKLTIFQALAKGDKLSLVMQKITEIGATELAIFDSDFCDVKANTTRVDRLETIAISASKQCGRASVTKQTGVFKLKEVAEKIKNYDAFLVAYEAEDGLTLSNFLISNKHNLKNIAIMIGAEGGFSEKEIELLKKSGAKIVSLGKRILRTETASIVCAGLAMQILEQ